MDFDRIRFNADELINYVNFCVCKFIRYLTVLLDGYGTVAATAVTFDMHSSTFSFSPSFAIIPFDAYTFSQICVRSIDRDVADGSIRRIWENLTVFSSPMATLF